MSNGTTTLPIGSKPPPLAGTPFTPAPPPTAPGTYPPSPHGSTHVTTDLVPVVTTSTPGLTPQLSGNPNTWLNGNGIYSTPPGTPLNIKGTVPTSSALPATGNAYNDLWVTADTGHAWVWNGTVWVDVGQFTGPPGATGPAGPPGAGLPGPAGQGYTWMGAWDSSVNYVAYQNVSYQGSSYVCITAHINQIPTNTTYWNIIAQIGAPGAPGAAGAAGAAGPPGGAGPQGSPGNPAYSLTTAQVTIPAIGATTTVTLASVSWANVGDYVSVQGAGGSGQSAVLQITAINTGTNTLTLLNPTQGGGIPPASTVQAGLLNQLSGNQGDYVGGDNTCHNLITTIDPEIWSVRLRSFNAIGNPTFEVDQRNVGTTLTKPANGTFIQDRWQFFWTPAALGFTIGRNAAIVTVPGTSFCISQNFLRFTLTTPVASLAAGDYIELQQFIEGPYWRELCNDVHSVSLLVRSSVNSPKIGVVLHDNPTTKSLTKLCTLGPSNTWTLIPLPNLPVFPAGNFTLAVGQISYGLGIVLGTGSTLASPANDVWQTGNFVGAVGQDNWLANAANSTFDIGFVQHEPGALCTTSIDKPFTQNYDECLRYFQKSYPYGQAVGAATNGIRGFVPAGGLHPVSPIVFKRTMAKAPTVTGYSSSGAVTNVRDNTSAADRAITTILDATDNGFNGFFVTGGIAAIWQFIYHFTADTGW